MATEVNLKASLAVVIDGERMSIDGTTPNPLYYDLTAPKEAYFERQAMAAAYADIDLSDVGWTDVTKFALKNHSTVTAEKINVLMTPKFTGGTDNTTFDGTALAATQTAAGYYQRCTVAGTSQGKTWAVGDYAVYLGSSGVYLQITPQKFRIRAGDAMAVEVIGNGTAWKANADSGTPQLGKLAVAAIS
jgi:hypothetical protein